MVDESKPPSAPRERLPINIEDEMRRSYMEYAMSVIVGRALPDVRDGLKPVHRRALFTMYEQRNFHTSSYVKSARIVGDMLGKYHPHGDTAAYETIVRMAQTFSMRYLLVDGQGNFGSVDGDAPAAMRYTEVRLTALAGELLHDLDKKTVDMMPNYDGKDLEPTVLPAAYPNLLVNGSQGIAVGMATNMPPHNIAEVIDACVALINDGSLGPDDLMQWIKGPDFPTAGIIRGTKGIVDAYRTGRGKLRVRARTHFEEDDRGDVKIVVTELPYQVNKAKLLERIGELVKEKEIEGIRDLRDESDRDGMRMVIELKRDAMGQVVLNQLLQRSDLEVTFGVLNLAVVAGRPQVLNLKEILQHFIDHRRDVVTRRCTYELEKRQEREHLLEGYVIALDHIDEVVALIRASQTAQEARTALMGRFGLSEVQSQAILDMRLQRLTGLERDKILAELAEVRADIARLKAILANERLLLDLIIEELIAIRDKYGDARRTEIAVFDGDLSEQDLIPNEDVIVTLTSAGYIKRTVLTEYQSQKRGGSGKTGTTTKDEDFVIDLFASANHHHLLVFTSAGRVFTMRVWQLPEGSRYSKGKPIVNLISLEPGETVKTVLPLQEFSEGHYLLFATRRGIIKKTDVMAYSQIRVSGIKATVVDEGDDLVAVRLIEGDRDVMLTTRKGLAIRFKHEDARPLGRVSRGVTGVKLRGDDEVVSMDLLERDKQILTVTANGYGKRSHTEEYRITRRAGMGVFTIVTNARNGSVVGALQVDESDQIMLVTDGGTMIRFRVSEVRLAGRHTQGVRLVRLRDDEKVAGITRIADADDDAETTSLLTPDEAPDEGEAAIEDPPQDDVELDDGDPGDDD